MKRLFLFLIPLLLVACARQQFQIDGVFTADDGTPVWLIDAQQKDTLSRTEVSGGRFLFKGIVEEPFFAYVGRCKYILLDHWASWCGPCKAEMPYIRKTWEAFHGECFEVVGIAVNDKRENTLQALRDLDMPWPQILDGKRLPIELYGVNAIPHLILFGPDGTILRRGLRGEEIYSEVAELFATSR